MATKSITSADRAISSFSYSEGISTNSSNNPSYYLQMKANSIAFESNKKIFIGPQNKSKEKNEKGFIFLHGVMGSRLYYDDETISKKVTYNYELDGKYEVAEQVSYQSGARLWIKAGWPLNLETAIRAEVVNRDIILLECNKNGKSIKKIKTGGVDEREFGIDKDDTEFGALGFYTDVMSSLKSEYGDENAIFLTYDWRKGIEEAVKDLQLTIEQFSQKYDAVYLIAHSMGGLVANFYLKDSLYKNKIRLITLGTPFLGAPKALHGFNSGELLKFNLYSATIKKLVLNFRGAYDLLPTEEYLKNINYFVKMSAVEYLHEVYDDYYKSEEYLQKMNKVKNSPNSWTKATKSYIDIMQENIDRKVIPALPETKEETNKYIDDNFNSALRKKSTQCHEALSVVNTFNSLPFSCAIVGFGHKTIKRVFRLTNGSFKITYATEDDIKGDGTVPLISSTMNGRIDKSRLKYVEEEHGAIAKNTDVIKFIHAKINNWEDPLSLSEGYNVGKIKDEIDSDYDI